MYRLNIYSITLVCLGRVLIAAVVRGDERSFRSRYFVD